MSFLDFIKEYDRVRFPTHCLRQLTAFLISNISRRRSDQTGNRIFLHILTHVDPDHVVFIIKKIGRQRLGQLCFSHSGRPQEKEGSNGFCGILDPGFGAQDRFCHFPDRLILSDHPLMQFVLQSQNLLAFSFCQLCDRYSGPAGDNLCDLLLIHTFMHQGKILLPHLLLLDLQLLLQLGQFSILQFCRLIQIIISLRHLDLLIQIFNLFS